MPKLHSTKHKSRDSSERDEQTKSGVFSLKPHAACSIQHSTRALDKQQHSVCWKTRINWNRTFSAYLSDRNIQIFSVFFNKEWMQFCSIFLIIQMLYFIKYSACNQSLFCSFHLQHEQNQCNNTWKGFLLLLRMGRNLFHCLFFTAKSGKQRIIVCYGRCQEFLTFFIFS